ncbi:hypothetical protein A2960_00670 [Candidatus Gottesmanbacteria bacterium RIFCSPLOWO2_01_FULL_39_12b]|uniref:Glycosyl transferase family 1 domain-containing protein n=1 Tax=Candidatus Gottesmanbacteria bacterium RIFCSPLOWO2_01_FULL_39_12b TaxID=1798388 RepID=A0A1F6APR5_9BACT|nr:MAG: hypothetical protein A2960_00670 [Candidatus Gottesmanbacteria bacterium RIFCSPLOWO2_01_FULL_39_12b]
MKILSPKSKLKIGIYSPYMNIIGGGERYLLTIAGCLQKFHNVYIHADSSLKKEFWKMFQIDIRKVKFVTDTNFNKFYYDVFFYTTDGSIFLTKNRKNFLVIQSPAHIPDNKVLNKVKLLKWQIICYSKFMQGIIESKLHKKSEILSPAVSTSLYSSSLSKKRNVILSVGRFFSHLHSKKHLILIDQFKKYYKKYFSGWQLIIAGGLTDLKGHEVVNSLQVESQGFPIQIVINPSFSELVKLYQKAKIYWHATGFNENLNLYPEKAEHFGITTLEAMAAGGVPVVFGAGGQNEIISTGLNGFLWKNLSELIQTTTKLIKDKKLLDSISKSAISRADDFSTSKYYEKLEKLIQA